MAVRHLFILWLFFYFTTCLCQRGVFKLFAGPSNGGTGEPDRPQFKPERQSPAHNHKPKSNGAKETNDSAERSPIFLKAHREGHELKASLRHVHARPQLLDKELEMGEYHVAPPRLQLGLNTPFDEIPMGGTYMRVNVFPNKSLRTMINPAPYANVFDVRRGIIGLEFDFKGYDTTPKGRQLHLSDILFKSYQRVCEKVAHSVPPRYVVVSWIITYDTKRVLHEAYEKHDINPSMEHTWRPGSAEHEAILGTTHGKVVMHMLMDFCNWSSCRVPANIKSRFWKPLGTPAGWHLLIELEARKQNVKDMV